MIRARLSKYGLSQFVSSLDDDVNFIEIISGNPDNPEPASEICIRSAAKLRALAEVFDALSEEAVPASTMIQDQLNERICGPDSSVSCAWDSESFLVEG